jgi:PiT family inorganic phosphate transporter
MEYALIFVVAVALAFDYVNGFHDAANSIATVVSTRVLTPRIAVMWAAFFNFAAFLVFGDHVAATIANDVVEQNVLSIGVVFAGLVGAIAWDLITFYLGLPTSSSHALVGGMAGAAVAKAGFDVLVANGLRTIGVFIVLSPLIGLALGLIVTLVIFWTFRRNRDVSRLNRGGIVGVGAARRLSAVRWGVAGRVVWAWVLTIPGAFTVSFLSFLVVDLVS